MNLQELEKGVLITNFATAGDGGSLFFKCETTLNEKFTLLFTQCAFLNDSTPKMLPGRIYLNQKVIDLKSQEEKLILNGIAKFSITNELKDIGNELGEGLAGTFQRLTEFYTSDAAIEIKKKVDNQV